MRITGVETNGEHLQTPGQPINKSHSDTEIITSSSQSHLGTNVGEINPGQASPKIYISDSSNTGVMSMSYGGSSPQEGSPLNAINTCQIRSSDNVYLDSVPSTELGLDMFLIWLYILKRCTQFRKHFARLLANISATDEEWQPNLIPAIWSKGRGFVKEYLTKVLFYTENPPPPPRHFLQYCQLFY